jgi:hypothetical protein
MRVGRTGRGRCAVQLAGLALLAGGCAQTDVVARAAAIECLHAGDCMADGECAPTPCGSTGLDADLCAGDAPPQASRVQVGDGCSDTVTSVPGFRFALCSCTDVVSAHPLTVDGAGDADPATVGPDSVGIVGELSSDAIVDIAGSLQLSGDLTLPSEDALRVGGVLVQTPNPACNCRDENLLDVAALVQVQATDASAVAAGFDPARLEDVTTDSPLELGCGRFRVARIAGASDLRIRALGRVALFVEGDVALDRGMDVTLDPGASFDLFVAGNVRVGAAWLLGGIEQAGRVRVYVGGGGTLDLSAEASIAGLLYAPRAELVTRGDLDVYGPLFVRRAAPGGELRVHAALAPAPACGG